ncbi:MAG: hypothetical protein ACC618_00420 [Patescibacteria group bacterium]
MAKTVGIVLLYGLFSPRRKDYKEYLDFIAKEIKQRKVDKLFLCGGFTDPKKLKLSEASTAEDYLKTRTKFNNYELEDKSINTNQNLEFVAKKLKLSPKDKVVVYCDLTRKAKVIWIALHFILGLKPRIIYKLFLDFASGKDIYADFSFKNVTVKGFDFPGKSKEEMIGQTYATLIDAMALYDKEVENMDITQRKKDFGLPLEGK